MTCSHCGAAGSGRFCSSCGAPLQSVGCAECGADVPAGNRFCTNCGAPAGAGVAEAAALSGAGAGTRGGQVGWWIAGGLLLILCVVTTVMVRGGEDGAVAGAAGTPIPTAGATSPAGGALPDLTQMTPREAADRLFNRVMMAAASGDTIEADQFLPMALDAYDMARPLNEDGLFHLALLQRAGGDFEGALATASEGLESNPNHLLNLHEAAKAAIASGDGEAGRAYYQRLLDAWDREMAMERVEYTVEHADLMPTMRSDAETYLAGSVGP